MLQTVPIVIAAAGALIFKEDVGWRRWTAILIGLLGVVVVIRPGLTGFTIYSLLAFASVFLIALRDIATNRIVASVPTITVLAVALVAAMLSGAAMGLGEDWIWPRGLDLLEVVGAGLFLVLAYAFIIIALRSADLSLTAPFRYTIVVWAVLFGFLFWGDRPDALTVVGGSLIVGSGIFTLYRERQLVRRKTAGTGPTGWPAMISTKEDRDGYRSCQGTGC